MRNIYIYFGNVLATRVRKDHCLKRAYLFRLWQWTQLAGTNLGSHSEALEVDKAL